MQQFLLFVFTIVFAILEKTRILGTEDGHTKKNLNAMLAFVIGFLVIASSELVRVINTTVANVVLLLVLSILFMLLAGSFHSGEKEFFLEGNWKHLFMFIMFAGLVLIFLGALGWLQAIWLYTASHVDGPVVGSFILLIVVVGAMVWITGSPKAEDKKK